MRIDTITHLVHALTEHLTDLQEANRSGDRDGMLFCLRSIIAAGDVLNAETKAAVEKIEPQKEA